MKTYQIYLEDKLVGNTIFENVYPNAGVIIGKIKDLQLDSGYMFFKRYCKQNHLTIRLESRNENMIATGTLHNLKIVEKDRTLISGTSNQIIGSDKEGFEVSLEGVSSTLIDEKFSKKI